MKALLDTCVILDFLMDRGSFADGTEEVFDKCACQQIEGFLFSKSVCGPSL